MRIDVYEILATNSLSGSRIIINDNFKMLEEGLNKLYNNINIDLTGKMTISDVRDLSANNINTDTLQFSQVKNGNNICMKIDQTTGHLILFDDNGEELDVNKLLQTVNGSNDGI